ncbi:hypothetical protein F9C11_24270 [Amycolatopsis sp. VS8301801F10]|uniref:hypothetical protein n=1 Tax=Amycolatopsis sp. VS8301801F10 TaxID=2652442 RepID=UPI0038FC6290
MRDRVRFRPHSPESGAPLCTAAAVRAGNSRSGNEISTESGWTSANPRQGFAV